MQAAHDICTYAHPSHQRCWTLNWTLMTCWKVSLLFSPEDTAFMISNKNVKFGTLRTLMHHRTLIHFEIVHFKFNKIQDYLHRVFYDTIVAKQLYKKLHFYNRFIYCRSLIYLTYGKMRLNLYIVWGLYTGSLYSWSTAKALLWPPYSLSAWWSRMGWSSSYVKAQTLSKMNWTIQGLEQIGFTHRWHWSDI